MIDDDRRYRRLIEDITQKIVAEYKPKKIILFGSYAYGDPTEESDIDLLIIKSTDEKSMQRWLRVRKILREFIFEISISPFVYTEEELNQRRKIKDFFIEEIIKKGEVLYG
jgi:predicted nucleotidyltransferase